MNQINQWATVFTICSGLLGQTLFVALYSTRGWRKYRITRALMIKSVAFWLIFVLSFGRLVTRGPRPGVDDTVWFIVVQWGLDAFILGAIYYQLYALIEEVRTGRDTADTELRNEAP